MLRFGRLMRGSRNKKRTKHEGREIKKDKRKHNGEINKLKYWNRAIYLGANEACQWKDKERNDIVCAYVNQTHSER